MMEQIEYSVYKPEELIECLNTVKSENEEVKKFFSSFSFNNILNQNIDKENSAYIFKNFIKEDTTKSKIISALNKLNQTNLTKVILMIREITFQSEDELLELVNQCIQKIKRDSEIIKPLVATLCWELLSTYFLTSTGEKIYFRKLLLTAVKNDYLENTNFESENWSKEKGEKTMVLIGTLFNNKIVEEKVMASIINDFKNKITYNENAVEEEFAIVDKSIHLLSCLVSTIIKTEETKTVFGNLDTFLEKQMTIYEEKKCISKKIRLVCKNCIEELRK
jgi:hypothetical protein